MNVDDTAKYTPIAILPMFSNICESIIKIQLTFFWKAIVCYTVTDMGNQSANLCNNYANICCSWAI